jgi:hypothetical protein
MFHVYLFAIVREGFCRWLEVSTESDRLGYLVASVSWEKMGSEPNLRIICKRLEDLADGSWLILNSLGGSTDGVRGIY